LAGQELVPPMEMVGSTKQHSRPHSLRAAVQPKLCSAPIDDGPETVGVMLTYT
jgi:hypothetical protein